MATKNIAISEEAYQRLKAVKKPGESFTDVIERMTRSRGILELSGMLSRAEATAVRGKVKEVREEGSRRVLRTAGKLS
jgi:predicted CopG family antitoxin